MHQQALNYQMVLILTNYQKHKACVKNIKKLMMQFVWNVELEYVQRSQQFIKYILLLNQKQQNFILNSHICPSCALFGQHQNHLVRSEEDVLTEISNRAQSLLETFEAVEEKHNQIKESQSKEIIQQHLEQQRKESIDKLNENFEKFKQAVQAQHDKLLSELENKYNQLEDTYTQLINNQSGSLFERLNEWKEKSQTMLMTLCQQTDQQQESNLELMPYVQPMEQQNDVCLVGDSILRGRHFQIQNLFQDLGIVYDNIQKQLSELKFEKISVAFTSNQQQILSNLYHEFNMSFQSEMNQRNSSSNKHNMSMDMVQKVQSCQLFQAKRSVEHFAGMVNKRKRQSQNSSLNNSHIHLNNSHIFNPRTQSFKQNLEIEENSQFDLNLIENLNDSLLISSHKHPKDINSSLLFKNESRDNLTKNEDFISISDRKNDLKTYDNNFFSNNKDNEDNSQGHNYLKENNYIDPLNSAQQNIKPLEKPERNFSFENRKYDPSNDFKVYDKSNDIMNKNYENQNKIDPANQNPKIDQTNKFLLKPNQFDLEHIQEEDQFAEDNTSRAKKSFVDVNPMFLKKIQQKIQKNKKLEEKNKNQLIKIAEDQLEYADFTCAELGDEGIAIISEIVSRNKSLKTLKLVRNKLTDQDLISILDAIDHHPNLVTLNLSNNRITTKFFDKLETFLKKNQKLQEIYLNSNIINQMSAKKKIAELKNTYNITVYI